MPQTGADMAFEVLAEKLRASFRNSGEAWPEAGFEALALEVFRYQFEANAPYRGFSEGRGATPETVTRWQQIPAVPTDAFRALKLSSASVAPQRVFRTSGTTRGERRGEHLVPRLSLYHASLLPTFAAGVLGGDGPAHHALRFLSLIPSAARLPDSSLSEMVEVAMSAFGAEGSGWFAESDSGLDAVSLATAFKEAEADEAPVLVLGTAFAFVHWLDGLRADERYSLPPGSRLLETGGFKGRSREVSRPELYAALADRLGIAPEAMINEYGMTELLSQYYDSMPDGAAELDRRSASPVREAALGGESLAVALDARRHVAPPWLRVRVVDPLTLEELPDGERGLLVHHDLANLGSVAAVLTEDFGFKDERGLKLLGRVPGASPRGCSIAMDELLSQAGR